MIAFEKKERKVKIIVFSISLLRSLYNVPIYLKFIR